MKLKKGSKEAKAFMAKIRKLRGAKSIKRTSTSKKQVNKEVTMARKKRKTRNYARMSRRTRSKAKGLSPMALITGGLIYGAGRSYIDALVAPITSKIPMGNLADNVVLGAGAWFVSKKSGGIVKQVAQSALAVESAMAGADLMASRGNSNAVETY